jgi:cell wall-associated NlpC family hydrolase
MAQKGLSGIAVGTLAVGTLLAYAGFRGVSPLQALKDVMSGSPAGVSREGGSYGTAAGSALGGILGDVLTNNEVVVVAAAQKYKGDIYSQSNRTKPGYSDCSSFVAKAFRTAGHTDIGASWTTDSFLASSKFRKISAAEAHAADVVVSAQSSGSAHMVLMLSSGQAIGQQRTGVNVKTGPVDSLFSASQKNAGLVYLRYRKFIGKKSVTPMSMSA